MLASALKQAPTFFVDLAPGLARRISTLRHYPFKFHAIGGLQQLEAVRMISSDVIVRARFG
jgi:hypothetical protein